MTASSGLKPAAKALMLGSSMTYTGGTGMAEAMAISSTTLSSRRSARSWVDWFTRRPPRDSATARPPPRTCRYLYRLASPTMPSTPTLIHSQYSMGSERSSASGSATWPPLAVQA